MRSHRALAAVFGVIAGMLWAADARADFQLLGGSSASARPAVAAPEALVPGSQGLGDEIVSSFGNDLPLKMAVLGIVPKGALVSYTDSALKDISVSWQAGHIWRVELSRVLGEVGANFSESGKRITISPMVEVASPENFEIQRDWAIRRGATLEDTLDDIARREKALSGLTLDIGYETQVEWFIGSDNVLHGSARSVIETLLGAFASDSEHPLRWVYHRKSRAFQVWAAGEQEMREAGE